MSYVADDLKLSQIPHLLDEYKKLALENLQMKKTLQSRTATNNTSNHQNSFQNGTKVIPPPSMLTPTINNDQSSLLG